MAKGGGGQGLGRVGSETALKELPSAPTSAPKETDQVAAAVSTSHLLLQHIGQLLLLVLDGWILGHEIGR